MSLKKIIENTPSPRTVSSLTDDLKQLGVKRGDMIIVHSALSSLGWVCGGAQAVVEALIKTVGEEGTLIMPAQSPDWSDPEEWCEPEIPQEWWSIIKKEMPAFDPAVTPTQEMGAVAEYFRTYPGVIRSSHPLESFCAWGKHKEFVTKEQPLDFAMGENSPLEKIYSQDGKVLLIGVGYNSNTSMHLSEHRVPFIPIVQDGCAMIINGERVWKTYKSIEYGDELFDEIGEHFEKEYPALVTQGKVGSAFSRLMLQRDIVDYAEKWFKNNKDKLPFIRDSNDER